MCGYSAFLCNSSQEFSLLGGKNARNGIFKRNLISKVSKVCVFSAEDFVEEPKKDETCERLVWYLEGLKHM